jgi:hypothetical protein
VTSSTLPRLGSAEAALAFGMACGGVLGASRTPKLPAGGKPNEATPTCRAAPPAPGWSTAAMLPPSPPGPPGPPGECTW